MARPATVLRNYTAQLRLGSPIFIAAVIAAAVCLYLGAGETWRRLTSLSSTRGDVSPSQSRDDLASTFVAMAQRSERNRARWGGVPGIALYTLNDAIAAGDRERIEDQKVTLVVALRGPESDLEKGAFLSREISTLVAYFHENGDTAREKSVADWMLDLVQDLALANLGSADPDTLKLIRRAAAGVHAGEDPVRAEMWKQIGRRADQPNSPLKKSHRAVVRDRSEA